MKRAVVGEVAVGDEPGEEHRLEGPASTYQLETPAGFAAIGDPIAEDEFVQLSPAAHGQQRVVRRCLDMIVLSFVVSRNTWLTPLRNDGATCDVP